MINDTHVHFFSPGFFGAQDIETAVRRYLTQFPR